MNPIYTGKDVSFIDTKQAQRVAENTLLAAEKFGTLASLLGARFPTEAVDKAWRQLLFGAHHDGITGSESDQVYLDLLGGWREAVELGQSALDGALRYLGSAIDTSGRGSRGHRLQCPVLAPHRSRADRDRAPGWVARHRASKRGWRDRPVRPRIRPTTGRMRPSRATIAFVARDVPALGYRTFRMLPADAPIADAAWRPLDASAIENDAYRVSIDAARGGAIASIVDKRTGAEVLRPGEVGNELRAYHEYPNHPLFQEGPWHLTPDGRFTSAIDFPTEVVVEISAIGQRVRVEGPFEHSRRTQEITLLGGVERVELATELHDFRSHDRLFRVRFPVSSEGGRPVSEVGNGVIGRPFGRPNVDVAVVPFTLDHPAYNWFGLGATARVALGESGSAPSEARASRAIGIAEVVTPDDPGLDAEVRRLVVALVGQGVTSTVSLDDGHRYGVLHIDSNLPDVRIAIGGPTENTFVAAVLDAAMRAIAPSSSASWALRAGRGCGSPSPATRNAAGNRSRTCAARATCRSSSWPGRASRQPRPPSMQSLPISTTA